MFRNDIQIENQSDPINRYKVEHDKIAREIFIGLIDSVLWALHGSPSQIIKNNYDLLSSDSERYTHIYTAAVTGDRNALNKLALQPGGIDLMNKDLVPLTVAAELMVDGYEAAANLLINEYGASTLFVLVGAMKAGKYEYADQIDWIEIATIRNLGSHYGNLIGAVVGSIHQVAAIEAVEKINRIIHAHPSTRDLRFLRWYAIGMGAIMANDYSAIDQIWSRGDQELRVGLFANIGMLNFNYLRSQIPTEKEGMQLILSFSDHQFRLKMCEFLNDARADQSLGLSYRLDAVSREYKNIESLMSHKHMSFDDAYTSYHQDTATHRIQSVFNCISGLFGRPTARAAASGAVDQSTLLDLSSSESDASDNRSGISIP